MNTKKTIVGLLASLALSVGVTQAEEEQLSRAEIAEMVNNPLSYLWMFATQNDYITFDGSTPGADKIHANITTVMPVMPMQLTEDYKLIVRPWIPFVNLDIPRDWRHRKDVSYDPVGDELGIGAISAIHNTSWNAGVGDIGFWAALASNEASKPPFVYTLGVTAQFPTASREETGTGRYSAGPMGLAFYIGEKWIVGGLFQHWWDYAGDDDRAHINKTNFQYVVQYRLTGETNIGMSPNFVYDWTKKQYDLPIGLGANTMINIGKLPVKVGGEVYKHFSNGPDQVHSDWHVRLFFVPILPSPKWSRKPIF